MALRTPRWLVALVALVTTLLTIGSDPVAAASPSGATGRTYHVDCSQTADGDGSQLHPFNSLASVNALTLTAADQVLFQRGTACSGTLAPQGGGAAGRPIVFGAYGPAAQPLPSIVGTATGTSAVTLADMSHVVIQDLALQDPLSTAATTDRQGLSVTATTGVVSDVVAQRLDISNVVGLIRDQANFSGGIVFSATAPSGGFDGITIRDNTISDLSNNGITVSGRAVTRPPADQPWPTATAKSILVTHNTVRRVTGNGVIILRADAPRSTWNEVDTAGMANRGPYTDVTHRICNAGLWFWETDNAVAEHNYVHDMVFKAPGATSGCDGEAFDMGDSSTDNTLYQYNVSSNNTNAILVVASSDSTTGVQHRATFRYNLSIDDKSIFGLSPGCTSQPPTPAECNGDGLRIHNNTYVSAAPQTLLEDDPSLSAQTEPFFDGLEFKNNIVVATGTVPADAYFFCGTDCSDNLFSGMPSHGTAAVLGDPGFVDPNNGSSGLAAAPGFKIGPGSPAACAGVAVAPLPVPGSTVTSDYFGLRIQDPPGIGFAEGSCITA